MSVIDQVRVFTSLDAPGLETKLNEFLSTVPPSDIIDIKYILAQSSTGIVHRSVYTAMVVYKYILSNPI